MQSFTTQSHTRNFQGNVVLPQTAPHGAAHHYRATQRKLGIACGVMALAVTVTGTLLGATTLHNRALQQKIHALTAEPTHHTAPAPKNITVDPDDARYHIPTTLEEISDEMEVPAEPTTEPAPQIKRAHGHHRRPVRPMPDHR